MRRNPDIASNINLSGRTNERRAVVVRLVEIGQARDCSPSLEGAFKQGKPRLIGQIRVLRRNPVDFSQEGDKAAIGNRLADAAGHRNAIG